MEFFIPCGNCNTFQAAVQIVNGMDTIYTWNTQTQKSISCNKTDWEEGKKEERNDGGKKP